MSISEWHLKQLGCFLESLEVDLYPEAPSPFHTEITAKAIQRLLELYPLTSASRVLDVGCGQGLALEMFGRNGIKATGVTLGEHDLSVCRAHGHDVIKMDQSFLEFEENSFDVVWARHVVEHSFFPFFTLLGFYRVLKPGGLLYLEVPAPDTDCHHEWNRNHYSVLTKSSWRTHLARSEFELVEELNYQFVVDAGNDEYWGFYCLKGMGEKQ
jgi:SAM-dependent methyltransferase